MGKNLHRSVIAFLEARLKECDKIDSSQYIAKDAEYYIINVIRKFPYVSFALCISDDYRYTITNYYSKPKELHVGDFILLARPEANFSNEIELLELSLSEKIYIGKIGRLIKFLNRTSDDAHIEIQKDLDKLKEEENNKRY